MYLKLIDIINIITCFQLAFFIFYLIHKGRKKISNNLLSAFFVSQFIVILYFILVNLLAGYQAFYIKIAYCYYPFIFLWGPLIYYYVKSHIIVNFRFKIIDIVHLLPFFFAVTLISYYYISDVVIKYNIVKNGMIYKWFNYLNFLYYFLLFFYNLSALFLLIRYQRNLQNYCSFVEKGNLVWLKIVLYGYIVACIINFTINYAGEYFTIQNDVRMLAVFTPFFIFFNILFYKAIITPYVIIMPEEKPKYSGSYINQTDISAYSSRIELFFFTHKPYLNPTLTLSNLAMTMGLSEKIISQVINQQYNQNFLTFINSYRVEEAKRLLNDFYKNKSTMLGISLDSGFNSRSAFYGAFKKHTGMTPTEYCKSKV